MPKGKNSQELQNSGTADGGTLEKSAGYPAGAEGASAQDASISQAKGQKGTDAQKMRYALLFL